MYQQWAACINALKMTKFSVDWMIFFQNISGLLWLLLKSWLTWWHAAFMLYRVAQAVWEYALAVLLIYAHVIYNNVLFYNVNQYDFSVLLYSLKPELLYSISSTVVVNLFVSFKLSYSCWEMKAGFCQYRIYSLARTNTLFFG